MKTEPAISPSDDRIEGHLPGDPDDDHRHEDCAGDSKVSPAGCRLEGCQNRADLQADEHERQHVQEVGRRLRDPHALLLHLLRQLRRGQGQLHLRIAAAGLEAVGKRPPQAEKWLEGIKWREGLRNADGTSRKDDGAARETARVIVTVLRLKGKVADTDAIAKVLKSGQRADGGFGKSGEKGSDLESSYQVMRAFHMLEKQPADVEKLRAFVGKCRNADGGYGISPGKPSQAGPTYFAAIVLHWLGQK